MTPLRSELHYLQCPAGVLFFFVFFAKYISMLHSESWARVHIMNWTLRASRKTEVVMEVDEKPNSVKRDKHMIHRNSQVRGYCVVTQNNTVTKWKVHLVTVLFCNSSDIKYSPSVLYQIFKKISKYMIQVFRSVSTSTRQHYVRFSTWRWKIMHQRLRWSIMLKNYCYVHPTSQEPSVCPQSGPHLCLKA